MSGVVFSGQRRGRENVSWDEIAKLPEVIEDAGSVVVGALGSAVPARVLIEIARPDGDVGFCTAISTDGSYSASIPIVDMVESGWLAFRSNGLPLPESAGGPIRLTVAKGRTLCWNVKNVAELKFTATKQPDSVPARPKH
jgi:DMSO/TMAO reductase YedYZ molybdopterin-dependent catalytic subunit